MRPAVLTALLAAAAALAVTAPRWVVPAAGLRYLPLIKSSATAHGVPFLLLARLLWQESHFDPNALNARSGAAGIAQFMPATAQDLGINPYNPDQAIPAAAKYLAEIKRYLRSASWGPALAGYNWGMGNVRRAMETHGAGWLATAPLETRNYVTEITQDTGVA